MVFQNYILTFSADPAISIALEDILVKDADLANDDEAFWTDKLVLLSASTAIEDEDSLRVAEDDLRC